MNKINFNDFCYMHCDGLYEPKLPLEAQCTGYHQLKKMIAENITPATIEDIERWENNPTDDELISIPHIKYLRFLHPVLRPFIINNWEFIKTLNLN